MTQRAWTRVIHGGGRPESHVSGKQASAFKPLRLEASLLLQHRSSYSNTNMMTLKRREASSIKVSYLKAVDHQIRQK